MSVQRKNPGEAAPIPAPRIFARKRVPPTDSLPSGWTGSRLSNVPTVVSCMCSAASDDIFAQVRDVVLAGKRRREAAASE